MPTTLVTGAAGQIGTDLVRALRARSGVEAVVATDLAPANGAWGGGPAEMLDVTDASALARLIRQYEVDTIYHLASLLSATGERKPNVAWEVNVNGLRHVLEAARELGLRVFWPSSIAVFGPTTPRLAPQRTVLEPTTVYGVTKVTGELLCQYYHAKHGVDVRSVRYPGLISYTAPPGGGTTDYAVAIFHAAAAGEPFTCFVGPETRLPMMYMPDAIEGTLALMHAPADRLSVRTSYNVGALTFTAAELADAVTRRTPDFEVRYEPDYRQAIADSWPAAVDDSDARRDWGWRPRFDLEAMVEDMVVNLEKASSDG